MAAAAIVSYFFVLSILAISAAWCMHLLALRPQKPRWCHFSQFTTCHSLWWSHSNKMLQSDTGTLTFIQVPLSACKHQKINHSKQMIFSSTGPLVGVFISCVCVCVFLTESKRLRCDEWRRHSKAESCHRSVNKGWPLKLRALISW